MAHQYQDSTEHIDVRYVAHLARLTISDAEAEQFQRQLDHVLAYMEQLKELDVSDVEPMAHAIPMQNVLRADEPRDSLPREVVLGNAPSEVQSLFRVPNIID